MQPTISTESMGSPMSARCGERACCDAGEIAEQGAAVAAPSAEALRDREHDMAVRDARQEERLPQPQRPELGVTAGGPPRASRLFDHVVLPRPIAYLLRSIQLPENLSGQRFLGGVLHRSGRLELL